MKERELKVGDVLDLVEVVRCKDCKHSADLSDEYPTNPYYCRENGDFHNGDWFCADGQR